MGIIAFAGGSSFSSSTPSAGVGAAEASLAGVGAVEGVDEAGTVGAALGATALTAGAAVGFSAVVGAGGAAAGDGSVRGAASLTS